MPRREIPEPPERGSLRWHILARQKFWVQRGGLRLVHPVKDKEKDAPGRASSDIREDDDEHPGTGRG